MSFEMINSRLKDRPEWPDPVRLSGNHGLSFVGSIVLGMGFTLTPDERDKLVSRNKKNAERIFPYIGGAEVNTSPTQEFHRYVMNFGNMSLEEAGRWPDLLDVVRNKVKPERDKLRNTSSAKGYKQYWWRFARYNTQCYAAIDDLPKCLVTARVSKHLCFSFQPMGRIYNEKLYVFPLPAFTHFAVLQSRVHAPWVWLLSSTLEERLNYSASDCFETFPFPDADPRAILPPVEAIGRKLYEARAAYMIQTGQGLTKTYNALKDPDCSAAPIVELRHLHQAMDRAVLDSYGWEDLEVPPFTEHSEPFEDEILDRLHSLNATRAKEESV